MGILKLASALAALSGLCYAQSDSVRYCDPVTTICYQSYTEPNYGITVRIALPNNVTGSYPAILQIVSVKTNPWAGLGWGGTMQWNPLTVTWPNGATAVPSARFAFGLSLPGPYDGAEHTLLKGSGSNSTHWYITTLCRGCTYYQGNDGEMTSVNATGTARLAWAAGDGSVHTPASNTSDFDPHKSVGKWTHDLNAARSSQFEAWVAANLISAPGASSVPATKFATSTRAASSAPAAATSRPVATASAAPNSAIPASCSGAGNPRYNPSLASGWKATKVLGGLTSPRSIVFDSKGNMLVVQSGKGISVHAISAEGCVTSSKMLISQNNLNHGIAFSADGKTLYASAMSTVYQWSYNADTMAISGSSSVVVKGMFSGVHSTRTLLIAPHKPNLLLVSHGSAENLDYPTGNPATGRSVIRVFDLTAVPSGGYQWATQGWLAGYGMRNEVGMAFDGNNMLWGVENSADSFTRGGRDIHIDNPAEELNYIGDVTKENKKWFGYPTCYTVWKPSDFTDVQLKVGDQFVLAPNSTFKDSNCVGASTPPALSFQAHSAPIDIKFDAQSSNAYVTFHGSWNRSPTTGFKLVAIPFTKGSNGDYRPVAEPSSNTGYQDVFYNPNVAGCVGNGPSQSSGCARPCGLSFDQGGRLYMTSDTTSDGEVWVLGKP